MTETEAAAYLEGSRVAWASMLQECLKRLGMEGDIEEQCAALVAERVLTVSALRDVCAEHGDNDWPDELHLADVVEKHLYGYLGAGQ